MIEIKNKLSNSNERKKQEMFNRYMFLKKILRYRFLKFFPLTQKEKNVYKELKSLTKPPLTPDKSKYYMLNRKIHLLSVIPKDELENFYFGIQSLFKNNPAKSVYRKAVVDSNLREDILNYEGSTNNSGWTCLGAISPKDKELINLIDGIDILLFGFSSDYVGVSFELLLSDKFNKYINKKLIGNIEKKEMYSTYYVGNKKFTTRNYKISEIVRKEELDDVYIELKVRCHKFLNKYINIMPITDKSPISLDEYVTNYQFNEEKNQFLLYYDIYDFKSNGYIDIVYEKTNPTYEQEFKKAFFCFNCLERKSNINRSSMLIIQTKEEYQDNFLVQSDLVNYFIKTLHFFLINELDRVIAKARRELSTVYEKKTKELYNNYNKISKEISKYKMLLDNVSISKFCDWGDLKELEKEIKYQNNRKNRLFEKYNSIEKEFSNLLTIKNYQSSTKLSKVSIWIAVISIIITTIFSVLTYYNDSEKNTIKDNKNNIFEGGKNE